MASEARTTPTTTAAAVAPDSDALATPPCLSIEKYVTVPSSATGIVMRRPLAMTAPTSAPLLLETTVGMPVRLT